MDKLQEEEAPKASLYTREPRAQPLRCNYEICAIFKFAHLRVCAYRLCSAKLSFSEAMPSPGGKVPPQGADEERRHPLIRNADKLEGTAFKNCTVLRTAFTIDTFRRSSSVSLRSTASPRGKPWALPRQCYKFQFSARLRQLDKRIVWRRHRKNTFTFFILFPTSAIGIYGLYNGYCGLSIAGF